MDLPSSRGFDGVRVSVMVGIVIFYSSELKSMTSSLYVAVISYGQKSGVTENMGCKV